MVDRQWCQLRTQHALACFIMVCTLGASAIRQQDSALLTDFRHAVAATTDANTTAANNSMQAGNWWGLGACSTCTPRKEEHEESFSRSPSAPSTTLHVIGDTHGDRNYLVRCLLSTGRFDVNISGSSHGIKWKASPPAPAEDWQIVILGDMIDRMKMSRKNLETVKALQDDPTWGKRLVAVLGNHEAMMLRLQGTHYGDSASGWLAEDRFAAMAATQGEDFALIEWLRNLPVAIYTHGVLMLHAGISVPVAEELTSKAGCTGTDIGSECGKKVVDYINKEALGFFAERVLLLREKGASNAMVVKRRLPNEEEKGWLWHSKQGILWFRRHSSASPEHKSGNRTGCDDVARVGKMLGASMVAVGHTAHRYVTKYCSKVPVYSTDTHPSYCYVNNECDFSGLDNRHNSLEMKNNVPQSLRIAIDTDTYHYKSETCVFGIHADRTVHEIKCYGFRQREPVWTQKLPWADFRNVTRPR